MTCSTANGLVSYLNTQSYKEFSEWHYPLSVLIH